MYEYVTGEEILPSNQKQIIKKDKFNSPFGKNFEMQTKTMRDQEKKQVDALKDFKLEGQIKAIEGVFSKDHESNEIKNELHKIKRHENKVSKRKTQKRA